MNFIDELLENVKKEKFIQKNVKKRKIYLFSKYAWIAPIKDKKGVSIVNVFRKIISESQSPKDEENQIKYGLTKEVNFAIILLKMF